MIEIAGIKEVALRAGVSISTVSSVVNKSRYVSRELTQSIEKAIEEIGYETNAVARSLKSKKNRTIGVVVPSITMIFFPQIIKGIEEKAVESGYNIMLYSSKFNEKIEKKCAKFLENCWVDGLILDSVIDLNNDQDYMNYLMSLRKKPKPIPIVFLEHCNYNN